MKYKNVFGIVGWKNSGKTALVESLVKYITEQGHQEKDGLLFMN